MDSAKEKSHIATVLAIIQKVLDSRSHQGPYSQNSHPDHTKEEGAMDLESPFFEEACFFIEPGGQTAASVADHQSDADGYECATSVAGTSLASANALPTTPPTLQDWNPTPFDNTDQSKRVSRESPTLLHEGLPASPDDTEPWWSDMINPDASFAGSPRTSSTSTPEETTEDFGFIAQGTLVGEGTAHTEEQTRWSDGQTVADSNPNSLEDLTRQVVEVCQALRQVQALHLDKRERLPLSRAQAFRDLQKFWRFDPGWTRQLHTVLNAEPLWEKVTEQCTHLGRPRAQVQQYRTSLVTQIHHISRFALHTMNSAFRKQRISAINSSPDPRAEAERQSIRKIFEQGAEIALLSSEHDRGQSGAISSSRCEGSPCVVPLTYDLKAHLGACISCQDAGKKCSLDGKYPFVKIIGED